MIPMADYSTHVETTHRLVISLDLPTNAVELQKAIIGMKQELDFRNLQVFDNTITVESDGDELRLTTPVPEADE